MNKNSINSFKPIYWFAIVFICNFACKKYPEGPTISFRTKASRLANVWVIKSVTVGGKDETTNWKSAFVSYELNIKEEGNFSISYLAFGFAQIKNTGKWSWIENKKKVFFDQDNSTDDATWTVIKLKEKELIGEAKNSSGQIERITLIPK